MPVASRRSGLTSSAPEGPAWSESPNVGVMSIPSRSLRTSVGVGLGTTGGGFTLVHLVDREVLGLVLGVAALALGTYLAVTGRQRDRANNKRDD
jgi:hypothetical protein